MGPCTLDKWMGVWLDSVLGAEQPTSWAGDRDFAKKKKRENCFV